MAYKEHVQRCAASSRCRQAPAFTVTSWSWTSVVCEKHLGIVATRRLESDVVDSLTIKTYEAVTQKVEGDL